VEVGKAVFTLNLIDPQLDFAERMVFILLEVGKGDLENTALESVVGVLQTSGTVDESLSNISDLER